VKHIRDYKLFEGKLEDIKNDIEGILVELVDNKYIIEVKLDEYVVLSAGKNRMLYSNDKSSITIAIKSSKIYNSNDIEDYVLTVLDYLKSKFTDKLEEKFYTGMQDMNFPETTGKWNTYSEFPKNLYIRQFIVSIRKK
jgi:hypothetical protein